MPLDQPGVFYELEHLGQLPELLGRIGSATPAA
jgi:hypothetical protein